MKTLKTIFLAILVIIIMPIDTLAFSPATHMYIGYQTHDVWADFDTDLS